FFTWSSPSPRIIRCDLPVYTCWEAQCSILTCSPLSSAWICWKAVSGPQMRRSASRTWAGAVPTVCWPFFVSCRPSSSKAMVRNGGSVPGALSTTRRRTGVASFVITHAGRPLKSWLITMRASNADADIDRLVLTTRLFRRIGPDEDVIGIGVCAQGRGRLAKLTAFFDAVSQTAWEGGLRRAAWKEPLTHWLPLFVHAQHALSAAPLLADCLHQLADACPQGEDSHLPAPVFRLLRAKEAPQMAVDAIVALPEIMHQLLKQVLYGDRHASLKLLKGYFVMHRLFLHCCDRWPVVREAADLALEEFIGSDRGCTKQATPWLAYILQLLTISNIGWDRMKDTFLKEALAREVQFILPKYPSYRPTLPGQEASTVESPASEWRAADGVPGSDRQAPTKAATELAPSTWRGADRGWTCLSGGLRTEGVHAFSVRVRRLPPGSAVRVGWVGEEGDELVGATSRGWGHHASSSCFGQYGWKMHN
ncbi:rhp6, partial [Symbiodinium necroappetens]